MITKEFLKTEIEKVPEEYLEILYKIIRALEAPTGGRTKDDTGKTRKHPQNGPFEWQQFIKDTYGCLADAPIQREDQGRFEQRETLE